VLLVSQNSFELERLLALLVSVDVVVLMELVGSLVYGEELVAFLFPPAEVDLFLVLVHSEGGQAVDDLPAVLLLIDIVQDE